MTNVLSIILFLNNSTQILAFLINFGQDIGLHFTDYVCFLNLCINHSIKLSYSQGAFWKHSFLVCYHCVSLPPLWSFYHLIWTYLFTSSFYLLITDGALWSSGLVFLILLSFFNWHHPPKHHIPGLHSPSSYNLTFPDLHH